MSLHPTASRLKARRALHLARPFARRSWSSARLGCLAKLEQRDSLVPQPRARRPTFPVEEVRKERVGPLFVSYPRKVGSFASIGGKRMTGVEIASDSYQSSISEPRDLEIWSICAQSRALGILPATCAKLPATLPTLFLSPAPSALHFCRKCTAQTLSRKAKLFRRADGKKCAYWSGPFRARHGLGRLAFSFLCLLSGASRPRPAHCAVSSHREQTSVDSSQPVEPTTSLESVESLGWTTFPPVPGSLLR